jgi:hypothetical protein
MSSSAALLDRDFFSRVFFRKRSTGGQEVDHDELPASFEGSDLQKES